MAGSAEQRKEGGETPWSMIIGACVVVVVVVGGVVVVHENSSGKHGKDKPAPLPTPAPAPGPVLGSAADDSVSTASTPSVDPEDTQQCHRCKRTCDFFDASPVCCNAECGEQCPNLMASFGCAPVVRTEMQLPGSPECQRCKKACDYFGSSCCMDSLCRDDCDVTRPMCTKAGYTHGSGMPHMPNASTLSDRLRGDANEFAHNLAGGAEEWVKDHTPATSFRDGGRAVVHDISNNALAGHWTNTTSWTDRTICTACNQSVRVVGTAFGCTDTCRQKCPEVMRTAGCLTEESNPACFKCKATCALLGTNSFSTQMLCCRQECMSMCPMLMTQYGCEPPTSATPEDIARRFGVDVDSFRDNATRVGCEGCMVACDYNAEGGACCSTWCRDNCQPEQTGGTPPVCTTPRPAPALHHSSTSSSSSAGSGGHGSSGSGASSSGSSTDSGRHSRRRNRRSHSAPTPHPEPSHSSTELKSTHVRGGRRRGCKQPALGDVRLSSYPVGVAQIFMGTPTSKVSNPRDPDYGWRTVCGWHGQGQLDRRWKKKTIAEVVCKQLGYASATDQSQRTANFEFMADETAPFNCAGSERTLKQCRQVPDALKGECTSGVRVSCKAAGTHHGPEAPECGSAGPD